MRRPGNAKDKIKAGQRKRPRNSGPKSRAKGPQPTRERTKKVQDKVPCSVCGNQLWEHPRCVDCDRFMWCTDQVQTEAGLMHSHGCPVVD
jgi:ribosomal protein L44E